MLHCQCSKLRESRTEVKHVENFSCYSMQKNFCALHCSPCNAYRYIGAIPTCQNMHLQLGAKLCAIIGVIMHKLADSDVYPAIMIA